jgi:hypothetical protein
VICALKPLSGKGAAVLETTGTVVGAPGDPLLVGFFGLQPIANPKVPQAAASKTILNFMINDSSLLIYCSKPA